MISGGSCLRSTERPNVDLFVSLSVDLHGEQHLQTDLPDRQPRGKCLISQQTSKKLFTDPLRTNQTSVCCSTTLISSSQCWNSFLKGHKRAMALFHCRSVSQLLVPSLLFSRRVQHVYRRLDSVYQFENVCPSDFDR